MGTHKRMHTVIESCCTGCELCIPPCPVDCIEMLFMPEFSHWDQTLAHAARNRMNTREIRLKRQKEEQAERLEAKAIHKLDDLDDSPSPDAAAKKAVVQAALARARARRQAQTCVDLHRRRLEPPARHAGRRPHPPPIRSDPAARSPPRHPRDRPGY